MAVTLDWLGVSTYRLTVNDTVVFLDAYMDRVPDAPPVGMTTSDVKKTDFVLVGHSHFDHLWGAEKIAHNTGATIIGSYETARIMTNEEVPETQLIAVGGGERIRLSSDVVVRVFPSQHSCIWATQGGSPDNGDATNVCLGDRGLELHERIANLQRGRQRMQDLSQPGAADMAQHTKKSNQHARGDGAALAYLIETPEGSILWKDTSGHRSGIMRDLRPDFAILAAAGRGNVDGEPIQGSLADFVSREADLLRPRRVTLCHHDNWIPPMTSAALHVEPIRDQLARHAPQTELVEMGYLEGYAVFPWRVAEKTPPIPRTRGQCPLVNPPICTRSSSRTLGHRAARSCTATSGGGGRAFVASEGLGLANARARRRCRAC